MLVRIIEAHRHVLAAEEPGTLRRDTKAGDEEESVNKPEKRLVAVFRCDRTSETRCPLSSQATWTTPARVEESALHGETLAHQVSSEIMSTTIFFPLMIVTLIRKSLVLGQIKSK